MKPIYVVLSLLVAVLAGGYTVAVEKEQRGQIRQALELDECTDCGVEKLSDEELVQLVSIIASRRAASHLSESANNYLRKEGWVEAEVVGHMADTAPAAASDDVVMMTERMGKLYQLRPGIGVEPLPRGVYWTKNRFSSSWDVIGPDGVVKDFSATEL